MHRQVRAGNMESAGHDICLRPWKPEHAKALQEAAATSAASVGRWLPWCRDDYSLADAIGWIEHCQQGWLVGEHFAFGIFNTVTGGLLGGVGINRIEATHHTGNLGYWVHPSHQRKGVAANASRRLAAFGFSQLALARIEIVVLRDNLASTRTAIRLGARLEGIARQRLWVDGAGHDALVYGLTPTDLVPQDEIAGIVQAAP
jgi:ribosomal-protein-serine acetyltransferase